MLTITLGEYYAANCKPPGIECYHLYIIDDLNGVTLYVGLSYSNRCTSDGILNRIGKKLKVTRKEPSKVSGDYIIRYIATHLDPEILHQYHLTVLNPDELNFFGLDDRPSDEKGDFTLRQVKAAEIDLSNHLCPLFVYKLRCANTPPPPIYLQALLYSIFN